MDRIVYYAEIDRRGEETRDTKRVQGKGEFAEKVDVVEEE
jgi:hypothetical protein